jgi:hypothetical protein
MKGILYLSPFCKNPVSVAFTGITNSPEDQSVSTSLHQKLQYVTLLAKYFRNYKFILSSLMMISILLNDRRFKLQAIL